MIQVLSADASPVFARGPFRIRRIRPGQIDGGSLADPVIGPLSIVDHATLDIGTVVAMHEHRNDEILSYLWRGLMVHEDSTGQRVELTPNRLMMMNAGRSFYHEESTPLVPVEMLQIFVRPQAADLEPAVRFYERPSIPVGKWTLLGGPEGSGAPLLIRNQVRVLDGHLKAGDEMVVPSRDGWRQWLYVMDGAISADGRRFAKGDAITNASGALPPLRAVADSTLVAFLIDPNAPASLAGSQSGFRG